MPIGFISYYKIDGNFGYIDSPEIKLDNIYFHLTNCSKSYQYVNLGDEVSFELLEENEKGVEAKKITFRRNTSIEGLRTDFENKTVLKGNLKKIDSNFYVRDKETHILIRLFRFKSFIDTIEFYENRLNQIIEYRIVSFTHRNRIRAIDTSIDLPIESSHFFEKGSIEAQVIAKLKGGYQFKFFEQSIGFLPNSSVVTNKDLSLGEKISVTCIFVRDFSENSFFDLTENLKYEQTFTTRKINFTESLKVGEKYWGTVISSKGYGIFISLGVFTGLLHRNNIIVTTTSFTNLSKKTLSKILDEKFRKGQEIEIVIEEINNNKISLNWDISLEPNKTLYSDINSLCLDALKSETINLSHLTEEV